MNITPRAVLIVQDGPDQGQSIELKEGMTIIGRSALNDIPVEEPGVSRQHAAIRGDRSGFWVMDLGSRNGTFVNDNRVGSDPQLLKNWDKVELGGMSSHWVFMESQDTIEVPRPQ